MGPCCAAGLHGLQKSGLSKSYIGVQHVPHVTLQKGPKTSTPQDLSF
jgi:hypothetical protein